MRGWVSVVLSTVKGEDELCFVVADIYEHAFELEVTVRSQG